MTIQDDVINIRPFPGVGCLDDIGLRALACLVAHLTHLIAHNGKQGQQHKNSPEDIQEAHRFLPLLQPR